MTAAHPALRNTVVARLEAATALLAEADIAMAKEVKAAGDAPELRQPASPQDKIRRYEDAKRRWIELHPEATHVEYQIAMTRIACECGV